MSTILKPWGTARQFYTDAFGWKFRESTTRMDGVEEDPSQIAHFNLGTGCPGGGITKVSDEEFVRTGGKGGAVLYLVVEDLDKAMEVSSLRQQPHVTMPSLKPSTENRGSWREENERCRARRRHGLDAALRGHRRKLWWSVHAQAMKPGNTNQTPVIVCGLPPATYMNLCL